MLGSIYPVSRVRKILVCTAALRQAVEAQVWLWICKFFVRGILKAVIVQLTTVVA
jgi:hypothetical protein